MNFLCSTLFLSISKGLLALKRLRTNLYINYFIFCIVCLLAPGKLVPMPRLNPVSSHPLSHCFAKYMFFRGEELDVKSICTKYLNRTYFMGVMNSQRSQRKSYNYLGLWFKRYIKGAQ